jgi:hypothetical protein
VLWNFGLRLRLEHLHLCPNFYVFRRLCELCEPPEFGLYAEFLGETTRFNRPSPQFAEMMRLILVANATGFHLTASGEGALRPVVYRRKPNYMTIDPTAKPIESPYWIVSRTHEENTSDVNAWSGDLPLKMVEDCLIYARTWDAKQVLVSLASLISDEHLERYRRTLICNLLVYEHVDKDKKALKKEIKVAMWEESENKFFDVRFSKRAESLCFGRPVNLNGELFLGRAWCVRKVGISQVLIDQVLTELKINRDELLVHLRSVIPQESAGAGRESRVKVTKRLRSAERK